MTPEEFSAQYMAHFSQQQKAAVQAVNGAVLLLAVPGSGKTTVLVTRLGYLALCCGVDPGSILVMTYTVAATQELRARFAALFPQLSGRTPQFRTINGLSAKIIESCSRLRGPAFTLQENEGELAALVGRICLELHGEYPTDATVREIRTAITYCKNMMLGADEIRAQHFDVPGFFTIYTRYCQALRAARQMDYDDQMTYALAILRKHPDVLAQFQTQYPHLCVDESQDTSRVQHAIIRLLAEKTGRSVSGRRRGPEHLRLPRRLARGAAAVPADLPRREAAVHGGELPLHAPDPAGGERLHRQKPQPLPQDHPPRPPRRAAGAAGPRRFAAGADPVSARAGRAGSGAAVYRPLPQ